MTHANRSPKSSIDDRHLLAYAAQRSQVAYLFVDEALNIATASATVNEWFTPATADGEEASLVGLSVLEVFPELVGLEASLERMLNAREPDFTIKKVHHLRSAGGDAYFDLYLEPAHQFGAGILVIVSDVTDKARLEQVLRQQRNELHLNVVERRRVEEELRQAKERAEAANWAKSTFLASISHELRTPLSAIIGYSELLQEQAEHRGYTDFAVRLAKIGVSANHLLAIVRDVLDLSKIEAGHMELFWETRPVNGLVENLLVTARPLIHQNGNRLRVHYGADVGEVTADHNKLRQILLNLLSNAAKFTENGAVRLTIEREVALETRADESGDWLLFEVADSGIGIATEELERLFQPFRQAAEHANGRFGGTGLGLTISRHFARMMGGDITVASEVGRGTTFTLRLPLRPLMRPAAAPEADERVFSDA